MHPNRVVTKSHQQSWTLPKASDCPESGSKSNQAGGDVNAKGRCSQSHSYMSVTPEQIFNYEQYVLGINTVPLGYPYVNIH